MRLNRRHKAGLFLVLVAAGLSLFLEASAKQTAGGVLIGLAVTWLLGTISLRALGVLCSLTVCAVGVCIATFPVWEDWKAYSNSLGEYGLALVDLRLAIASGGKTESSAAGSTKTVMLPERTQKWKRADVSESGAKFRSETTDETMLRAIEKDFLVPEPTFSIRASLRLHLGSFLIGFTLALAGLAGCGWYIWSARRAKQNQAAIA